MRAIKRPETRMAPKTPTAENRFSYWGRGESKKLRAISGTLAANQAAHKQTDISISRIAEMPSNRRHSMPSHMRQARRPTNMIG